MGEQRVTDERLAALVAGSTPGPWRGDCQDGSIKYHILAGSEDEPVSVLLVDHKNAAYGFGFGNDGDMFRTNAALCDERLCIAAPDIALDLIDARAEIARLTAEIAGMREPVKVGL